MTAAELQLEHSVELEILMNGKKTTLLSGIEQVIGTTVLLTPIQINGKVRGVIEVERDLDNDKVVKIAKSLDNIAEKLTKIKPKKVIL